MRDVQHVLSQIADIRAQIVAGICFRGLTPEASVLAGLLALALAIAQTIWPEIWSQGDLHYILVWGGVITAYGAIVTVSQAVVRVHRLHGRMANTMLSAVLAHVLPFAAAGIIITLLICLLAPDTVWILPGLWQILIGLLGFSALTSLHLPHRIVWAATWYFLCGAIVLILSARSGELSPWMMGLPLAIGQVLVALILCQNDEEHSVTKSQI